MSKTAFQLSANRGSTYTQIRVTDIKVNDAQFFVLSNANMDNVSNYEVSICVQNPCEPKI